MAKISVNGVEREMNAQELAQLLIDQQIESVHISTHTNANTALANAKSAIVALNGQPIHLLTNAQLITWFKGGMYKLGAVDISDPNVLKVKDANNWLF